MSHQGPPFGFVTWTATSTDEVPSFVNDVPGNHI
jgi:hypothetical protein